MTNKPARIPVSVWLLVFVGVVWAFAIHPILAGAAEFMSEMMTPNTS